MRHSWSTPKLVNDIVDGLLDHRLGAQAACCTPLTCQTLLFVLLLPAALTLDCPQGAAAASPAAREPCGWVGPGPWERLSTAVVAAELAPTVCTRM